MLSLANTEQLSRIALLYLLAVFLLCNALLAVFLPWWLLPVAGGCLWWRLLIFTGRISFPATVLRVSLVLMSGVVLFAQYRWSVSLDVFVVLLLLGFSLKLLEIYHKQDAQLLLYIAFFVLMTVFLFSQTVVFALLVFSVSVVVLAALISVHSDAVVLQQFPWQPLRKGLQVFVMALPVMLFMFFIMPRFPPLWYMPLQTQQAKTGMSDSMTPGDVASLARSSDLVFRATFSGDLPPRKNLYWYGLFLDSFDGLRWTDSCKGCAVSKSSSMALMVGDDYQVVLEASGYPWVYLLHPSLVNNPQIKTTIDGLARFVDKQGGRRLYSATYLPSSVPQNLSALDRARYLALPTEGNEAARQLAARWQRQGKGDAAVVANALDFYHKTFSYTLQPPLLQGDRIDDFLFRTQSGFCEHFAGSFVFLMRAAGIPARVAVGYMGGEVDRGNHFVVVRQYDAHAWAEVWLDGLGWQRVDPTAAVAPERIDLGFAGAYERNAAFAGGVGLQRFSLLGQFQLAFDRFDYLWARWVLGYRDEEQASFMRLLGLQSPLRIALWGGGVVACFFALLCVVLYWRDRQLNHEHPVTRCYRRLCKEYAVLGVARHPSETPMQYASRVNAAEMDGGHLFSALSRKYYLWCYQSTAIEPSEDFFRAYRRLRWLLFWRRKKRQ